MFTDACSETVSIVEALVLGANGACIDIGVGSIVGGIFVFMLAVVVLRFVGMTLLRHLVPSLNAKPPKVEETKLAEEETERLKPLPFESPIKSTGAWGGKQR